MAGLNTIATLLIKVGVDASQVEAGMKKADAALTTHQKLASAGQKAVGIAVAGALGIAAKGAVDMENNAARFQAQTGRSAAEAADWAQRVNAASGSMDESLAEIVDASINVSRVFGVVGDDLDVMTSGMLDFADATGANAVTAADAAGAALSAWGMDATELMTILDQATNAQQKHRQSAEEYLGTLKSLSPAFRGLGLDEKEAAGFLNMAADAGADASQMTRSLGGAIEKLPDGTTLEGLMDDMRAMTDDTERARYAVALLGPQLGIKLASMTQPGARALSDYVDELEDIEGVTVKAKDAIESTFSNKIITLFHGLEAGLRGFGMAFGPALTGIASMGMLLGQLGVGGPIKGVLKAAGMSMGKVMGTAMMGMQGIAGAITNSGAWERMGKLSGGRFGKAFAIGAVAAAGLLVFEAIIKVVDVINQIKGGQQMIADAAAKQLTKTGAQAITDMAATAKTLGAQQGIDRILADTFFGGGEMDNLRNMGFAIWRDMTLTKDQIVAGIDALTAASTEAAARGAQDLSDELLRWADMLKAREPADAIKAGTADVAKQLDYGLRHAGPIVGPDIAGPIRKSFQLATQAVAVGFGNVKQALKGGGPDLISKGDRLANMDKRMGQVMAKIAAAVKAKDPMSLNYWERARAKQQLAIERLKDTNVAKLEDVKGAYRKAGGAVEGRWRDVRVRTVREADTATTGIVDAAGNALTGIDSLDGMSSGMGLMAEIAAGIRAGIADVTAASNEAAAAVAGPLKTGSPPKVGPLHTIDKWGKTLVDTWVRPIDGQVGRVAQVGSRLAAAIAPHPLMGSLSMAGAGGGGGGNHYHIGTLIADDAGIDALDRRIQRRQRLRGRGSGRYNDPG